MENLTMQEIDSMSVNELRALARTWRDQGKAAFVGMTGLQIAGMNKADLAVRFTGMYDGEPIPTPQPAKADATEPEPTKDLFGEPVQTNGKRKPNNGNGNGQAALIDALAAALDGRINSTAGVDAKEVEKIALDVFSAAWQSKAAEIAAMVKPAIKTIEIVDIKTGDKKDLGVQHEKFERLLQLATIRKNCFIVGAAGSGKTTAVHNVARALNLNFYFISVGIQTTKSDLMGYLDANGRYVSSHFRTAYEKGGVFLLDEIDAGNGNVLTTINAATANGCAAFPDAIVEKHPDFVFFGAGNTYGRGADRVYVGRNALDGATLDRFAVVNFDYDEALEDALCPDNAWLSYVRKIRAAVFDLKEKLIVSPRASIDGAKLKAAYKYSHDDLAEMLIFRGVNAEVKNRILARI